MKRLVCCLLYVLCIFSLTSAWAFPAQEHDKHLEKALFGDRGLQSRDKKAQDAFEALKHASYLYIDQYNKKGQEEHLNKLLKMQHKNWLMFLPTRGHYPKDISEIDYTSNNYHRRYTHCGWNYEFSGNAKGNESVWHKKWLKREGILRSTVEAVFDFHPWPLAIRSERRKNTFMHSVLQYGITRKKLSPVTGSTAP